MTYELTFSQTNLYLNETITISISPLSSNQYWWLIAINRNKIKRGWLLPEGAISISTKAILTSTLSYTLTSNSLLYKALNSGATAVYAIVWSRRSSNNTVYEGEGSSTVDLTLVNPPPIITTQNYDFGYTKTRIFSRINGKDNIF